ncbi:hypothetical protein F4827_002467 [Paraburkholderia bannensis]|uniref:Uncharacterized protein n=1 Tax=Paraburkholderia bannensis TaxID=765414 RepID=A0A7W9WR02_9BURK|nr:MULTISPECIES: hypothetical protein [Paraburkholderia]MBB3257602.1 hypothetical protein [Paraburkholderia sp. WP4_3_2]MBB6102615.1 hypothetical protein [Paraburkholderia bannensis]
MQFAYTTNGVADGSMNTYGNNEISVSGDVLTVVIGDSDGNRNIHGVGIFELKLLNKNLESAKQLASLLCSPKDPDSNVIVPILYGAKCNGEMKNGYISDLSRDVQSKISTLVDSLTNVGVQDGKKVVKLDLSLVSIDREKEGFLVSFRFSNSGDHPITFKTPDRWEIRMGRYMDILGVNGYRVGSPGNEEDQFGLALAGQTLVDPKQFPDGDITLAPHSATLLKMKTTSIGNFRAGAYDLNIGAFMNIKVIGIESSLLRVDFHSDYKNPTRITFDRDYPSTPEERARWEAMHKAEMSWQPVKPGDTFAEDGLYRAVSMNSSLNRSLQLTPFKAGDVATTDKVSLLLDDGLSFNVPVRWEWEATAPTPVKQWSPDMIADTVQFCEPDAECPRSGRWVKRIRSRDGYGQKPARYDLASLVTLRRGELMPPARDNMNWVDWEWVGA